MLTNNWLHHLKSPANMLVATGAVVASALAWNPLPLILYGLGEPVWLYRKLTKRPDVRRATRRVLEHELAALLQVSPCGLWTRRRLLPDYAAIYAKLVDTRDQAARIVGSRDDAAKPLEEDIVAKMDQMLRAYLVMARERLLLHCALARIYPQLPPVPPERVRVVDRIKRALVREHAMSVVPWTDEVRFVTVELAATEVRAKIDGFDREIADKPELADVYQPIIETLTRRLDDLARRDTRDNHIAAQLQVFPDQFDVIASKLATPQADVHEVVGDMKLLLEQTDDTVSFAEDLRTQDVLITDG
jgi:hypothetical protein